MEPRQTVDQNQYTSRSFLFLLGQGTVLCPTVSQFRALARPLNGHRQGRGGAIDKRITDTTENRPLSYDVWDIEPSPVLKVIHTGLQKDPHIP